MAKYELTSSKNCVKLGDYEFTSFFNIKPNPYAFYDTIQQYLKVEGFKDWQPKNLNKTLHENFGSKMPYRFSSAMYNTFIRDNFPMHLYPMLRRTGFHWKEFQTQKVAQAIRNYHLVEQAIKDKTENVLPLMLERGKTTQELKQEFGKGLWKKLAATSFTRMVHLAPLLAFEGGHRFVDVRSGILPRVDLYRRPQVSYIAAKIAPTIDKFQDTLLLVRDTVDMGHYYPVPDWSLRHYKEEHDKLVKEIYTKKFSDKVFFEEQVLYEGEYKFTLLNSQLKIGLEGAEMGHCVGSYAGRASRSDYLVFKVEGKERATLGISVSRDYHNPLIKEYVFDQVYGKYNQRVSDTLQTTAHKVVQSFNEETRREKEGWSSLT